MKINNIVNELAPSSNPGGGNYLKALASAWYNGTFNTGDLHKGIKSQEDVERILARGIHCGDGKIRKYMIGYNSDFDGVEIQSNDHYEHADSDDAGRDIDSRTGQPWGPYDVVEFSDNELDESVEPDMAEGEVVQFPKKHKSNLDSFDDCPKCGRDLMGGTYMGHRVKVCNPCKQVYLPPNSGIDQQGNKINEYGDTAQGQKMLTRVQKRAVDRVTSKKADADPEYARKNQDTANAAYDRMKGVAEGYDEFDDEEKSNLRSGDYVRDQEDSSGEVFIMRGSPEDRRVRIEDRNGSGWNISPSRLIAVDDSDPAIARYFNEAKSSSRSEPPEADYGDDYQDMVKRVKKLAGLGPLKTQYDPAKRVYRNMPTAVQPGNKK